MNKYVKHIIKPFISIHNRFSTVEETIPVYAANPMANWGNKVRDSQESRKIFWNDDYGASCDRRIDIVRSTTWVNWMYFNICWETRFQ